MKKHLLLLVGLGMISQGYSEFNFFKKREETAPGNRSEKVAVIPGKGSSSQGSQEKTRFRFPLEKGMTQEEVKKTLGEPDSQTLSARGNMIWGYKKEKLSQDQSVLHDYQVRFKKNGTVSSWSKVKQK